jgi:hypothetical protein
MQGNLLFKPALHMQTRVGQKVEIHCQHCCLRPARSGLRFDNLRLAECVHAQ